jgi:flagellar biogenesis protein FliO
MDGWDWLSMTFGMGFWIVLIGVVVYVAVRLAQRPPRERHL